MAETLAPKKKRMNGWNRLFIVVAVCWAVAAPFLMVAEGNGPVHQIFQMCADSAYRNYGASDSLIRLDMDKYNAEVAKCSSVFIRDFVGIHKILASLIGAGDLKIGLAAWGFILIPLCLLWAVGWAIGRIVLWVATGFR
jgi:TM2 domain-containing membrane protein YozV